MTFIARYAEVIEVIKKYDYGEYSEQEIHMVEGVKRAASFVNSNRRPMTNEELRKSRHESKL